MTDPRRALPSVDALVTSEAFRPLVDRYGRTRAVEAARWTLAETRERIGAGAASPAEDPGSYADAAAKWLAHSGEPSLRRVVNATGVVLHTNLGRAPLCAVALEAMRAAGEAYTNLEYDLEEGARGSRYDHCRALLVELSGAEDALAVNNNAAALVLALNTLAPGAGVAVSRGELVEIGGGFRIPEVLERSGARLVEVGATNRTRLADYERAVDAGGVSALLKVHRSNFRMTGFTEEVGLSELAALAQRRGVALVHDLGSGLFLDAERLGLPEEPTARDSLRAGADVVVVSGDKLLGGPQAGLVLGRVDAVARMRTNPLCRALRVDKVTLAGLEATLRLYRDPERAVADIPTLRMLAERPDEVRARADALQSMLAEAGVRAEVVPSSGRVGGGTYPGVELASWAVTPATEQPEALGARLRAGSPPLIARISDGRLLVDVRTVLPGEEVDVVRCLAGALSGWT